MLSNTGSKQQHLQHAQFVADLVALARQASSMRYNPITLSDEALTEVLHKAR